MNKHLTTGLRIRIIILQFVALLGLVAGAFGAFYANNFTNTQIHDMLAPEQIAFPQNAAQGLPSDLKAYAGQQVLTGDQAHAYAEKFIGLHLKEIGADANGVSHPYSYWSGVAHNGLEIYRSDHRVVFAFPTNDDLFAVFVGWPIDQLGAVRADVEGQLMAVVDREPSLSDRVRAGHREERIYGAAQLPNFLRKPFGAGWALVGDAGCHKDPFAALGVCDALRDSELLADSLTDVLSGARRESDGLSDYERRRNDATIAEYEATIRSAQFVPPPPEVMAQRAMVRDDPQATNEFYLAYEGRLRPS